MENEPKKVDYVPLKPGEKVTRIDTEEITEEKIEEVKKKRCAQRRREEGIRRKKRILEKKDRG